MSEGAVLSFFGDGVRRLLRRALGQSLGAPEEVRDHEGDFLLRRSSGLREFWKGMPGEISLQILDLGAASQANINFVTDLGHKIYTADLLHSLLLAVPKEIPPGEPQPEAIDFFRENLNFAEGQFDGILCWDLFDFVPDPLTQPLIARLHRCLKPGGTALSFFHTGTAGQRVPVYQYRICAQDTLQMTDRGTAPMARNFNNRTIENLFRDFASLRFYLSRDSLREVISVR